MAAFLQTFMAQPGYPTEQQQGQGAPSATNGPVPGTAEALAGVSGATAQTGGFAVVGGHDSHDSINPTSTAATDSNSISQATAESLTGVAGGTAHTGGFAVVGGQDPSHQLSSSTFANHSFAPDDRSAQATGLGGFGGGLASSPNVPAPGTSINPETGKPHTAGLTRAELDAIRSKGADLLDPSPHGVIARRSSATDSGIASGSSSSAVNPEGRLLSALPGREQAARQLTGTAGTVGDGGEITPGLELPGGWGNAKQAPLPGTSPNAPSSVYDDITVGLEKVGSVAFGLIPKGLKDALNPDGHVDKGKQPMGSPPQARRSSVTTLFENAKQQGAQILDTAKQQGGKVIHEVQEAFTEQPRRESLKSAGRAPGTIGSESSVFSQVKNFLAEAGQAAGDSTSPLSSVIAPVTGPIVPQQPLPLREVSKALDEEIYTTAGAGKSAEHSLPSQENQGIRPGEVSMLPGSSSEAGVAVLPIEKAAVGTDGGHIVTGNSAAPMSSETGLENGVGKLGLDGDRHIADLAPPLPATILGHGAAEGATDLETAGLPVESSIVAPPSADAEISAGSSIDSHPTDTRGANDRTTSSASITAIRHGQEGHKPSPLAVSSPIAEVPSTGAVAGATSLTPGDEADGVGHPSSRTSESVREPESYPTPDHNGAAIGDRHATGTDGMTTEKFALTSSSSDGAAASPITPATAVTPVAPVASTAPATPATPPTPVKNESAIASTPTAATTGSTTKTPVTHSSASPTSKDRRSGSTGSNGKKKVGFMSKLKGEIKVISGKMSHDEEKVKAGERLKHGE